MNHRIHFSATEHGVAILAVSLLIFLSCIISANAGTRDIDVTTTDPQTIDLAGDTVKLSDFTNHVSICDNADVTIENGTIDGEFTIDCSNSRITLTGIAFNYGIVITGSGNTITLADDCSIVPAAADVALLFLNAFVGDCADNTINITGGQYDVQYFINYIGPEVEEQITDPATEPGGNKLVLYGGYYSIEVPAAICGVDTENGIVYEPAESITGKPLQYYVKATPVTPPADTPSTDTGTTVPTGDASNTLLPIFGLLTALAAIALLCHRKASNR